MCVYKIGGIYLFFIVPKFSFSKPNFFTFRFYPNLVGFYLFILAGSEVVWYPYRFQHPVAGMKACSQEIFFLNWQHESLHQLFFPLAKRQGFDKEVNTEHTWIDGEH